MHKRGLKVALVAVLTLIFVLGAVGVAFAQWDDLSLSILGDYGVTEQQVANISDGFVDGSWQPYKAMPRKQFVKMAVDAYKIPLVSPAIPTYSDVPASDDYYEYVEAATAAGLTNGVGGGKMEPNTIITREQAVAIIARWVADKNGYNLETMYTDADAAAILAAFPDASAVGPSLQKEMAFAIDFGIVWGDASGKLAPKANLSRIQGAAMLIRSLDIIPIGEPEVPVVPTKIELVSDDEAENLIGITHQYTYKVTQADGSVAPGVLVDFDTLTDPWYVGNIQPNAALTGADGTVTVNLISTEIGVHRVSAAAPAVAAVWSTKYWVALDEVYFLDADLFAQNNAGTTHSWEARVAVFGPGPLSTSRQDFYNALLPGADEAAPKPADGIAYSLNDYADELALIADGYVPRSLEGIPVLWEIVDFPDDPATALTDESDESVGEIVAAEGDGDIAADGLSAWAYTDATGLTSVDIMSEETGSTYVTAMADYVGNPYPGMLVNRDIYMDGADDYWSVEDWEMQPGEMAEKRWIPHTIGGADGPIDPGYTYANLGEEFFLTITLEDEFGNPVSGRQVEWTMQGIGRFITDDGNTQTDADSAAGNIDVDTTNAAGQAKVMVKSFVPGEQIVHAKVRDKGTGGLEGQFILYTAEVQWFDVNVATFDDPATTWTVDNPATTDVDESGMQNEALADNPVGTSHDFTLHVYGLKLEYDPTWNDTDNDARTPIDQTPIIDTDVAGAAYDGVFDAMDAEYFGGILLVNDSRQEGFLDDNGNGVIDAAEAGTNEITVAGVDITMSLVGGITEYDWDQDGLMEPFTGVTGIYLPLEGKDVTFDMANEGDEDTSNLGALFTGDDVDAVGSFTPATAVTDENGEAVVTVTSAIKGPQTIEATVDWEGNPHNQSELVQAYAKKLWVAGTDDVNISIWIDGIEVANNVDGELTEVNNSPYNDDSVFLDEVTDMPLNSAHVEVHVTDDAGNDLPDYEVVYLLEDIGTDLLGSQDAEDTYLPLAFFDDLDTEDTVGGVDYDQNGTAPDSDEPTPASDPYAEIVGLGGYSAFYFNQWLQSETETYDGAFGLRELTDSAVIPVFDPANNLAENPFIATDGAKAWTLDGFYDEGEGNIQPNELTGSHIDVQLGQDIARFGAYGHFKSIVKVMVYAPADGLVVGGDPIWHYQVHKVWENLVPTTITLTPVTAVNPADATEATAGEFTHSVTATVLDQFGNPLPGASVAFTAAVTEGTVADPANQTILTDATGQAVFTFTEPVTAWGNVTIDATASFGGVTIDATAVQKYFAQEVDLVYPAGGQDITIPAGICAGLNGDEFRVRVLTPTGTVVFDTMAAGIDVVYNNAAGNTVATSRTFLGTELVFVEFLNQSISDTCPNWVWDGFGGAVLALSGDDAFSGPLPIGFTFPFFGNTYDTFFISTNGIITFGAGNSTFTNVAIPNAAAPNNMVAPFWDDLVVNAAEGDTISYLFDGEKLIVRWRLLDHFNDGTASFTFQALLYPDGTIVYQYLDMQAGTTVGLDSATVGIENATGTVGVEVAFNEPFVVTGLEVVIAPDGVGGYTVATN